MSSTVSVTSRCRLCAREEKSCNLTSIFEEKAEVGLEKKIIKLLPIVVMPSDPLPKSICLICLDKLKSYDKFYDDTLQADQFLRKFCPSAPEVKTEDPVVEINDCIRSIKNTLKLPPKLDAEARVTPLSTISRQRQSARKTSSSAQKDHPAGESTETSSSSQIAKESEDKSLEGFIINHITSTDSVFTCKGCFRTFTKLSSALSHTCVKIEECGELDNIGNADQEKPSEKSLPPLKIRLFSNVCGKFICDICQKPFSKKTEVVEHLKQHFLDRKLRINRKRKVSSNRRKNKQQAVELQRKRAKSEPAPDLQNYNSVEPAEGENVSLYLSKEKVAEDEGKLPESTFTAGKDVTDDSESENKRPEPSVSNSMDQLDMTIKEIYVIDDSDCEVDTVLFSQSDVCSSPKPIDIKPIPIQRTYQQRKGDIIKSTDSNVIVPSKFVCKICGMCFANEMALSDHVSYHEIECIELG